MKLKWYARLLSILVLIAGALLSAPGAWCGSDDSRPLEESEQEKLFENLARVQKTVVTFQADFEEKRTIAGLRRPLRYAGRLYYHRDRLFFMAYTRPIEYILQVKGQTALMYVKGNPSADRVSMSAGSGVAPQARWFDWDPAAFGGEVYRQPDGYRFAARGKDVPGLVILVDRESLLVKQIIIDNGDGDITDIILTAVETDRPLPAAISGYCLPEGITVNEMDAP